MRATPTAANRWSDAARPMSDSVRPEPMIGTPQSSANWHCRNASVRPPQRCTLATAMSMASSSIANGRVAQALVQRQRQRTVLAQPPLPRDVVGRQRLLEREHRDVVRTAGPGAARRRPCTPGSRPPTVTRPARRHASRATIARSVRSSCPARVSPSTTGSPRPDLRPPVRRPPSASGPTRSRPARSPRAAAGPTVHRVTPRATARTRRGTPRPPPPWRAACRWRSPG